MNQPIWKNMLVKLDHFPRDPGWHLKNIWKDWVIGLDTLIILRQYDWMPHRDIVQTHDLVTTNGVFTHLPAHTFPTSHVGIPASFKAGIQAEVPKERHNKLPGTPMKSIENPGNPGEPAQFSPNYTDRLKPRAQT